ncbi:MAG TPA: hypothetical protein VFC78_09885 [Tepidisphaeraceae bacterium]|nr:hypothetical protein [Tepidisphaeraceae bacterium]
MKTSPDPSIHRHREQQIIQHVEKLLADDRLRIDTTMGRRPVTAFIRDVSRSDRALDLKRLMSEMNVPDRELQAQMPIGESLEVALTQTRWMVFKKTVGRLRVACVSPSRALLGSQEIKPMTGGEALKALASMPPSLGGVPLTVVLVSTSGFTLEAHEIAERRPDRTVILVEPNGAGGWTASGPAETKALADLFDPEAEEEKRQRVRNMIDEARLDLLTSGIATEKIAAKSQLPVQIVESEMKNYARLNPGLSAKRLDGRVVLFREGSANVTSPASDSGGSMGLIDRVRALFSRKGENEKKIAFLSERKAALSLQRDRAYEEMGVLEKQEASFKQQFKEAGGSITKRRVTSQLLQLRKDLERRQQLLSVLNQQVNVVSTHLHNLDLVQQGQTAKLPDTEEITADAVKAEEMLAQLEADTELAGSVGQIAIAGMSEEEKALFDELERETGGEAEVETVEPSAPQAVEQPARTVMRDPVQQAHSDATVSAPPVSQAPSLRAEPEAG